MTRRKTKQSDTYLFSWCKVSTRSDVKTTWTAATYRQSTSDIWTLLANNSKYKQKNQKDLFQHFRAAGRDRAFLALFVFSCRGPKRRLLSCSCDPLPSGAEPADLHWLPPGQRRQLHQLLVTDTAEEESLSPKSCLGHVITNVSAALLALGYTQTLTFHSCKVSNILL